MAPRDFFQRVRDASAALAADGHAAHATELIDAIETASTGGELMMRLRFVLRSASGDDALGLTHRQRLEELLAEVEKVSKVKSGVSAIDVDTGRLTFDSGLVLRPWMSLAKLELALPQSAATSSRGSASWVWCTLEAQSLGGVNFTTVLGFEEDALKQVDLSDEAHRVGGWDSWSEERELDRKRAHDGWLSSILGPPPYHYAWGSVESVYDPRSGASKIVIRYGDEMQ